MPKGIVYQNKDVLFKILSETYKEKSFRAYGLDLPRIKEVLPTNLPAITADEKRMDNLFLLEDDTLAIVDYESEDKLSNRVKYLNYITRVVEKFFEEENRIVDLRLIIIYTGDVEKASEIMETSCFSLRMESVFLVNLQSEEIYEHIKEKVERQESLTEEEQMQLVILPLTEKGTDKKKQRIRQTVELIKNVEEASQAFLLANLIVASDKFIDERFSEEIGRWLSMTKVEKFIEKKKSKEIAKKMLIRSYELDEIAECTGLTIEEVHKLREEIIEAIKK